MNIERTKTGRGFAINLFTDRYDKECSIQKSSLATEDAIWFGILDPSPSIMAVHAPKYGIDPGDGTGWVPYHIPEEVSIDTRMHLTRDQVEELLPILQKFVETGEV